jgi:hypothetical protein
MCSGRSARLTEWLAELHTKRQIAGGRDRRYREYAACGNGPRQVDAR